MEMMRGPIGLRLSLPPCGAAAVAPPAPSAQSALGGPRGRQVTRAAVCGGLAAAVLRGSRLRRRQVGSDTTREMLERSPTWHRYSDPDDWRSSFESAKEFGPANVEVEGTIPEDLVGGTLYRCGPGMFERGGVRYNHIIDGDGFVYAIRLGPEASSMGRFVHTAEFKEEHSHDKILYRSSFGTQPRGMDAWRNAFNHRLKNLANTTAMVWGCGPHAKLLALFEAGVPYKLDLHDLQTLGLETFDGELKPGTAVSLGLGPVIDQVLGFGVQHTAHPHIDPVLKRFVGWWSQIRALEGKARITVREWDDQWQPKSTVQFDFPSELVPHDFCLTPSFYIWCENRMNFPGRAAYVLGIKGPAQGLEPDHGAPNRFHFVTRSGPGSTKHLAVETPPWFCIHHSHAEEEELPNGDRRISIYSAGWTEKGLASGSFLSSWGGDAPDFSEIAPTFYWKTVVQIEAEGSQARLVEHGVVRGMDTYAIDHPHVDPRMEAQLVKRDQGTDDSRYCFMSFSNDDGHSGPPLGWLRVDLASGETERWEVPRRAGQFCEELVVVPKKSEKGSWLLGIMTDARRGQSCLCVLDGDRIEEGPVARIWLPEQLPHGLHGCFMPAPDSV